MAVFSCHFIEYLCSHPTIPFFSIYICSVMSLPEDCYFLHEINRIIECKVIRHLVERCAYEIEYAVAGSLGKTKVISEHRLRTRKGKIKSFISTNLNKQ